MRPWILSLVVLVVACSIDSTGLLERDAGERRDVSQPDGGPLEDVPPVDTMSLDVPLGFDAGLRDVPADAPSDVPSDAFEGGPMTPVCADPTLVACYLFDGDVRDSSANARHLTGVGVDFEDMGAIDGAVVLGDASQLSLPGVDLGLGVDFSIELWFQMKDPLGRDDDSWSIAESDGLWGIYLFKTGDASVTRVRINFLNRQGGLSVSTAGWHHLLVVSSAAGAKFIVDGQIRSAFGDESSSDPGEFRVGSFSTRSDGHFIGAIDHLRIWNRTLSDAEADALFADD